MARFELVDINSIDWGRTLQAFPDRTVFQTPAWLAFLAETQKVKPVLAALKERGETLGYFTALTVRKFGMKFLCSPLRGWSTPYMGFNLLPSVPRRLAVEALPDLAFNQLGCIHFEVIDPYLTLQDIDGLGIPPDLCSTMEIDLTQSEDELFNNMSSACRRNIRKAEKSGVIIEEAHDLDFADEFAAQANDVFAKQGLVAPFGADRVRALIRHLHPTGMLLLIRARAPDGRCIATGIFPATDHTMFLWGNASWRDWQGLRPNELIYWYAMRYWKQRGMRLFNMWGIREFKQKFGGRLTGVPMLRKSRYRAISRLRTVAPHVVRTAMRVKWKLKDVANKQFAVTGRNKFPPGAVPSGRITPTHSKRETL